MAIGRWLADGGFADVEECADVRMGESRDGARFAVEALAELRVGGQRLGEHFDRDGAIETRVSAFVHLAHAACPERSQDLVGAEPRSGRQAQLATSREVEGPAPICAVTS